MPLIIAIMAMITSCTTDIGDQDSSMSVEYTNIPIGFDAGSISRGTAQNSTWANNSTFAVSAYHIAKGSVTPISMLNEKEVKYDATSNAWSYSPVIYWPKEGTMDFFSYAPACEGARKEFTAFTPSHINHQAILMDCHVPASEITTIHTLGTKNGDVLSKNPHDASNQYDMMFAFERNVMCAEQDVTSKVTMHFAHVMAGIKINPASLTAAKIPEGTAKMVIGIGRIKTGGTLAICAAPNDVVWTLDGLEGTFYETYNVTWDGAGTGITDISREGGLSDAGIFFFPPQKLESGLTITAYFYDSTDKRVGYRTLTTNSITELKRGEIKKMNLQ